MMYLKGYRGFGSVVLLVFLVSLFLIPGCEDFQQFPSSAPPAEQPAPGIVSSSASVSSSDRAVLAVYEHLLGLAESYEAKEYLADFYTVTDNWTAELERFNDGSSLWCVAVDMTRVEPWEWSTYWQQASWYVYRDGKVIPSDRHEGNALRIEAELQKSSLSAGIRE
ncbi:hypothetical protein ACFLWN_02165 [Chloroflexota bacterium]